MGFTLIETVIAVGILGLIGAGILTALNTNSRATRVLDEQVVAANLAATYLESIKEFPYGHTYPNAGDDITIPTQYSVAIDIKCSSDGTTFAPSTGSENETLQKVTISVSHGEKPVLSICTYRTKR